MICPSVFASAAGASQNAVRRGIIVELGTPIIPSPVGAASLSLLNGAWGCNQGHDRYKYAAAGAGDGQEPNKLLFFAHIRVNPLNLSQFRRNNAGAGEKIDSDGENIADDSGSIAGDGGAGSGSGSVGFEPGGAGFGSAARNGIAVWVTVPS